MQYELSSCLMVYAVKKRSLLTVRKFHVLSQRLVWQVLYSTSLL
jgi:hypothetical protein